MKLVQVLLLCAASLFGAATQAQTYPSKPIRLVVPYPPGGPTDFVARSVGQKLSQLTGQQVDERFRLVPTSRTRSSATRSTSTSRASPR